MYPNVGGGINQTGSEPLADVESMMWILFLADGEHDLISISEKSGIRFAEIEFAADKLREVGLLDSADPQEVQES